MTSGIRALLLAVVAFLVEWYDRKHPDPPAKK